MQVMKLKYARVTRASLRVEPRLHGTEIIVVERSEMPSMLYTRPAKPYLHFRHGEVSLAHDEKDYKTDSLLAFRMRWVGGGVKAERQGRESAITTKYVEVVLTTLDSDTRGSGKRLEHGLGNP